MTSVQQIRGGKERSGKAQALQVQQRIYSLSQQPGAKILVPPSCTQTLSPPCLAPLHAMAPHDVPHCAHNSPLVCSAESWRPSITWSHVGSAKSSELTFAGGSGLNTLPLPPLHPAVTSAGPRPRHWLWPQGIVLSQDLTPAPPVQSCSVYSPALEVLINNRWDNIEIIFFFPIDCLRHGSSRFFRNKYQ